MLGDLLFVVLAALLEVIRAALSGVTLLVQTADFQAGLNYMMQFDAILPVHEAIATLAFWGSLIVVMWTIKLVMWGWNALKP